MWHWLFTHPAGWFFGVLGVWCFLMLMLTLITSWVNGISKDDEE